MALNEEQRELISAWIDGECSDDERRTVESLLASSDDARQWEASLRALRQRLRDLPADSLPVKVSVSLGKALDALPRTPQAPAKAWQPQTTAKSGRLLTMSRWRRFSYAASLLLVVGVGAWFATQGFDTLFDSSGGGNQQIALQRSESTAITTNASPAMAPSAEFAAESMRDEARDLTSDPDADASIPTLERANRGSAGHGDESVLRTSADKLGGAQPFTGKSPAGDDADREQGGQPGNGAVNDAVKGDQSVEKKNDQKNDQKHDQNDAATREKRGDVADQPSADDAQAKAEAEARTEEAEKRSSVLDKPANASDGAQGAGGASVSEADATAGSSTSANSESVTATMVDPRVKESAPEKPQAPTANTPAEAQGVVEGHGMSQHEALAEPASNDASGLWVMQGDTWQATPEAPLPAAISERVLDLPLTSASALRVSTLLMTAMSQDNALGDALLRTTSAQYRHQQRSSQQEVSRVASVQNSGSAEALLRASIAQVTANAQASSESEAERAAADSVPLADSALLVVELHPDDIARFERISKLVMLASGERARPLAYADAGTEEQVRRQVTQESHGMSFAALSLRHTAGSSQPAAAATDAGERVRVYLRFVRG